jgi:hypothetical protein
LGTLSGERVDASVAELEYQKREIWISVIRRQ